MLQPGDEKLFGRASAVTSAGAFAAPSSGRDHDPVARAAADGTTSGEIGVRAAGRDRHDPAIRA
jgi:hypothetical protein